MNIRFATYKDFPALIAIGHKFYKFNPYRHHVQLDEASLERTLYNLEAAHILLVVENDEGNVVGTAAAFVAPLYWNENELQGLEAFWWVDEEYRASGIGSHLRRRLQEAAKARGVKFWNMIALEESEPDKVGAMYEKAGMRPVERVYMKVI